MTDEALQKNMSGEGSAWKETVDPESGHIYYYNKDTHETRYNRLFFIVVVQLSSHGVSQLGPPS